MNRCSIDKLSSASLNASIGVDNASPMGNFK